MSITVLKKIPLSEQTIKRLKQLATDPLDDTYDSIVGRILDFFDEQHRQIPEPSKKSSLAKEAILDRLRRHTESQERSFDPFDPPNLTHTKVTSALFDGRAPSSLSWNGLLDEAVRAAKKRLGAYSEVRKIAQMNTVEGRKIDDGYHFLPDADLSVQGQDANDAWRCAALIACHLGCSIEVNFLWRTKEKAAHPGSNGNFVIRGRH